MKKRPAFSLIELIVATCITGFMALSLVTIYTTANRHMFQNFRSEKVKSDVALGMRAIRNAVGQATRITEPDVNTTGTTLLVTTNIDQLTGCYPIQPLQPVTWHYFCTATVADGTPPRNNIGLYYQTGDHGGSCSCPPAAGCTAPAPPLAACTSGQRLTAYLTTASIFSRTFGDIPLNDSLSVRVRMRSTWTPAGIATGAGAYGLAATQRPVDYTLDSIFSVTRSAYAPTATGGCTTVGGIMSCL